MVKKGLGMQNPWDGKENSDWYEWRDRIKMPPPPSIFHVEFPKKGYCLISSGIFEKFG